MHSNGPDGSEHTQYFISVNHINRYLSRPASTMGNIYTIPLLRHKIFVNDPAKPKQGLMKRLSAQKGQNDEKEPRQLRMRAVGGKTVCCKATKATSSLGFNSGNKASFVPTYAALLHVNEHSKSVRRSAALEKTGHILLPSD